MMAGEQLQFRWSSKNKTTNYFTGIGLPARDEADYVDEGVHIREVVCRSILNKTSISDYSLNCYTGCQNGCVYCYARYMQKFHPHSQAWGKFVDVKVNALETLKKQLKTAKPGRVFVSSACDGWQRQEAKWGLTRRCCQLLIAHGFSPRILTKSSLILKDLDILASPSVTVGVTITTPDKRLKSLWEPCCSSIEDRFEIIRQARRRRLRTMVMCAPLLPFLSDTRESIRLMFEQSAEVGANRILVDILNPRHLVWGSVRGLLRREFPDLIERYKGVLFDSATRRKYIIDLRRRISTVADRLALGDRVLRCF